jgi:site-specific recombinase XerD
MKMNSTENTLYRYLDLYERQLGRNKSQHTIVNYMSDLKQFINYLAVKAMSYNLDNFEREQFLDYLDYLKENFAPATVHRKAISLNGFLTFLNRTGRIKKTPFVDGQELQEYLPVIPKKKVKTLSKNQVKNLVFVADNLQHECMIRTFYDTGCRVSELVAAKWTDIENDFQRNVLLVRGKGKGGLTKERTVRISPKTMELLDQLKSSRDYATEFIFESERTKKPFTTRRLNQIIKEIATASGIEDISSHVFRKSIATNLIENGMPIEYVSEYLGHEYIETTKRNYIDTTKSLHDKVDAAFGEEI